MIKFLIMDVDGTLTDGKIYMSASGEIMKAFNIKDGYSIAHLKESGIEPIILTGRQSKIVENRAAELGITQVIQGKSKKETYIYELLRRGIDKSEISYIGDDLNDLPAMKLCGLVGCPADAAKDILDIADFVSSCRGGEGAVREFIEFIMEQQK